MTTRKAERDPEFLESMAILFADALQRGGKIAVTITHTSKSNLSYRYTVDVWRGAGDAVERLNATYWLAMFNGVSVVENYRDELRGHGIGFSRYLEAALDVCHAIKELTGVSIDPQAPKIYVEA